MKDEEEDTETRRWGDTGMFSGKKLRLVRFLAASPRGPSGCRSRPRFPVSPCLRVFFSSFILYPSSLVVLACFINLTLCAGSVAAQTKMVVAADGSGQFKTVQEAVNAVPQNTRPDNPAIILIKPGTYKELIYVQHEKRFVRLVGEDRPRES